MPTATLAVRILRGLRQVIHIFRAPLRQSLQPAECDTNLGKRHVTPKSTPFYPVEESTNTALPTVVSYHSFGVHVLSMLYVLPERMRHTAFGKS